MIAHCKVKTMNTVQVKSNYQQNLIKHQSNAHANKSINHNLCREGNVVQMHHLYTNNSGMQYSWLRWVFFLCTEDIAKLKLRSIYSKDIFELKLYHRPDKPRIPFEDMDCKLTFTVFDTNAKTIPDQNIRKMYKSTQKRNSPDPLA